MNRGVADSTLANVRFQPSMAISQVMRESVSLARPARRRNGSDYTAMERSRLRTH